MANDLVIRLTKKTLDTYKISPAIYDEQKSLFTWHGKVMYFHRRKCLFLINDSTFFSLLIPDLNQTKFEQHFYTTFIQYLQTTLLECGIDKQSIEPYLSVFSGRYIFQKSLSRRVLGIMNEQTSYLSLAFDDFVTNNQLIDITALNISLNHRIICKDYPIDNMKTILAQTFENVL